MVKHIDLINWNIIFLFRDEAIELADRAITMTKDERIQEFSELLNDALDQSKTSILIRFF